MQIWCEYTTLFLHEDFVWSWSYTLCSALYVRSPFAIPYSIHSLTSLFNATSLGRLKDIHRPYFHICRCFEIAILLAVLSKVRQTQIVISDCRATCHFVCYTLPKYARAGGFAILWIDGPVCCRTRWQLQRNTGLDNGRTLHKTWSKVVAKSTILNSNLMFDGKESRR